MAFITFLYLLNYEIGFQTQALYKPHPLALLPLVRKTHLD